MVEPFTRRKPVSQIFPKVWERVRKDLGKRSGSYYDRFGKVVYTPGNELGKRLET